MCTLKKFAYWCSVVGPIFSIIKGAIFGIIDAVAIAKRERQQKELDELSQEMERRFKNDNI